MWAGKNLKFGHPLSSSPTLSKFKTSASSKKAASSSSSSSEQSKASRDPIRPSIQPIDTMSTFLFILLHLLLPPFLAAALLVSAASPLLLPPPVVDADDDASSSSSSSLLALMQLKDGLDPHGSILTTWFLPGGSFVGVSWDPHGHVSNISLPSVGLSGFIPTAIAAFSHLSSLRLHSNLLHGSIPPVLFKLSSLSHLYLHSNRLSGTLPPELGLLYRLQELKLCCNDLEGGIPPEIGALTELKILSLHHNRLSGQIPSSLGYVASLIRVDLSFNRFNGSVPVEMGSLIHLKLLDVTNNSLSGPVPTGLTRLQQGFLFDNNSRLCGADVKGLRQCSSDSASDSVQIDGTGNDQTMMAGSVKPTLSTNRTSPPSPVSSAAPLLRQNVQVEQGRRTPSKAARAAVISGIAAVTVGAIVVGALVFVLFRRHKQKISSTFELADPSRFSHPFSTELKLFSGAIEQGSGGAVAVPSGFRPQNSLHSNSISSAAAMHRASKSFGSFTGVVFFNGSHQSFQYDLDELEIATNYFSDKNLMGKKSSHSAVYRGVLRDGSSVAIRALHKPSCRKAAGVSEFKAAVAAIAELRHENVVALKGFCYSTAMSECYLVYDFVANGTLQERLRGKKAAALSSGGEGGKGSVSAGCLDWASRARIASSVARALEFMHSGTEASVIHQNVSAANILLDDNCNAYLSDAGLYRLLADDIVYAVMKASAAGGYLAPEYVTTGRLTEKSDVYALGVVLLELLTGGGAEAEGRRRSSSGGGGDVGGGMVSWARAMIGGGCVEEMVDERLKGRFTAAEAGHMAAVAFACTQDDPEARPEAAEVVRLLRLVRGEKQSSAMEEEAAAAAACLSSGEDYPRRQQALFAERLLADNGR